jgi:hypothetical protein
VTDEGLVTDEDFLAGQGFAGELDQAPGTVAVSGTDMAAGTPAAGPDRDRACHEMLLRLAGRAPDGLMTPAGKTVWASLLAQRKGS